AVAESLPGWLADVCRNHAQPELARTPNSAARRAKSGRKSATGAGSRNRSTTTAAQKLATKAKQRWLVTPGFASKNFVPIAQRLSALSNLQATFDERLEAEKLEALAEFAAGAGHEINNPLAVISGRAQLFLRHEQDPERRRELAVINTQARRVHEMIADLMLFARPPEPQLADCDVTELIDAVTTELAPHAKQGRVEISVTLAEDLGTISADITQLQVALRAVCQNALETLAGRDDGRIEIAARTVEDAFIEIAPRLNPPPLQRGARGGSGRPSADDGPTHVQIAVRDNGPGMPPDVRRHAFDPFYSGRGAGRGLGNGLSKCWRILTAHGGRVEIDTKPCGTSVTMMLPISRTHSVEE
ncbi:MAG: ATP-binding protein, partial [Singulisphaera sp.]